MSLKVKVVNITSDVYEIGYVIKTVPEAGSIVREGDTVTIYVSKGADTVKTAVPNFEGKNEAQAYILLMENDLEIGKVTYERSDEVAGTVIEQSVEASLMVPLYTEIDLKVSGGSSYSGDGTTLPTAEDMKIVEPDPIKPDDSNTDNTDHNDNTGSEGSGTTIQPDDDDWMDDDWFNDDGIFKGGPGAIFG